MKNCWKIALGVRAEKLDNFIASLDQEERVILSLAEETRENEFGKLWLFKWQKWNGADPLIKNLLKALYATGECNYIYVKRQKQSNSRTEIRGLFEAALRFRAPHYSIMTGHFFEDINF